jgi:hypothetical protein
MTKQEEATFKNKMTSHDHHDDGDDDDGPEFPWYSRPVQRQRWGDAQPRPHAKPGDSFFDLFYVAAYVAKITSFSFQYIK